MPFPPRRREEVLTCPHSPPPRVGLPASCTPSRVKIMTLPPAGAHTLAPSRGLAAARGPPAGTADERAPARLASRALPNSVRSRRRSIARTKRPTARPCFCHRGGPRAPEIRVLPARRYHRGDADRQPQAQPASVSAIRARRASRAHASRPWSPASEAAAIDDQSPRRNLWPAVRVRARRISDGTSAPPSCLLRRGRHLARPASAEPRLRPCGRAELLRAGGACET